MQRLHIVLAGLLAGLLTLAGCGQRQDTQTGGQETAAKAPGGAAAENGAKQKTILFFGNSLTAGYGLEPAQAFPALIQEKLDSAKLNYKVINAGLSGETSAGGKSRISWVLRQPIDVFVLELGANDGLRGIPLASTRQNLQAILDTVRQKSPGAQLVIAGMQLPPNLGAAYTGEFREIFGELARKNNATLIPFLLEGVGGVPDLNQPDGIHPTAEGHRIVSQNVWQVLQPVLAEGAGT
ncbi:MAG: arylesterase [Cytophagales bacterium]|nr:arylesterase [Cytophagales bacterium]